MRSLLVVPLIVGLLAPASAPAPAEAQSAGSSARGTVRGTGSAATGRTVPTTDGRIRGGSDARGTSSSHFDPFFQPQNPFGTQSRFGTQPLGTQPRFGTVRVQQPERRRSPRRDYYYDGVYYPLVYYYPVTSTRVIHVQSQVVTPRTVTVVPAASDVPAVESCAVVTVLQPDHRGYWRELQLPVAGARNTDELQRVLDARVEEGVAFTIRDVVGTTMEIPARAALDRIVVDPCR
jgi:hypothetical protein